MVLLCYHYDSGRIRFNDDTGIDPNVPEKHPFRHWRYFFKKSKVILPPIIMIDQIFGDE